MSLEEIKINIERLEKTISMNFWNKNYIQSPITFGALLPCSLVIITRNQYPNYIYIGFYLVYSIIWLLINEKIKRHI